MRLELHKGDWSGFKRLPSSLQTSIKFLSWLIVIVFFGYCYLYFIVSGQRPWKKIDPTSSAFNIEDFNYEDYVSSNQKQFQEILKKIFPVGTPKEKVDWVLYHKHSKQTAESQKGAHMRKLHPDVAGSNSYGYYYKINSFSISKFVVMVSYDKSNKVIKIEAY